MIVFSYESGALSIPDDDIVACYPEPPTGWPRDRGQAPVSAVKTVQAKIADSLPPAA